MYLFCTLFVRIIKKYTYKKSSYNRGCLAYMFSLRVSGSKFLINLRRQFRVRKTLVQAWICSLFILCLKLLFRKSVTYVLGCSFIKICSLTLAGC